MEFIDIPSTCRFTINIRTRQTCGPGIYDYRFAQRRQEWVVSGLDRAESECSEAGIVPSSRASYDFLTGTVMRTSTGKDGHQKHSASHHAFPTFPLASFEAFSSRYEPD